MKHLPAIEEMLSRNLLTEEQADEIMAWYRKKCVNLKPLPKHLRELLSAANELPIPQGALR